MWLDVSARSWKRDVAAFGSAGFPSGSRSFAGIAMLLALAFLLGLALVPARAEPNAPAHAASAPQAPVANPRC